MMTKCFIKTYVFNEIGKSLLRRNNVLIQKKLFTSNTIRLSVAFKNQNTLQTIMSKVNKVKPSQVKKGEADFPIIGALAPPPVCTHSTKAGNFPKKFTDEELKAKLSDEEYRVTQKAGTERAFTGRYWDNHRKGIYKCVVCEEDLFSSDTKFESGSGWPSFYDVIEKGKVKLITDTTLMMSRTEVLCAQCGSHLGHVFNDGPKQTGQRYCMNSLSLKFNDGDGKEEL